MIYQNETGRFFKSQEKKKKKIMIKFVLNIAEIFFLMCKIKESIRKVSFILLQIIILIVKIVIKIGRLSRSTIIL